MKKKDVSPKCPRAAISLNEEIDTFYVVLEKDLHKVRKVLEKKAQICLFGCKQRACGRKNADLKLLDKIVEIELRNTRPIETSIEEILKSQY